jgi:hypothetical protein
MKMKKYGIGMLAGCAGLLAIATGALTAQPLCTPSVTAYCNLGTGQSPGTVNTASDPIWNIVSDPNGNPPGPAVLIGKPVWGAAPLGLHWIATMPGSNSGGSGYAGGYYTYQATFSGEAGVLSFSVKADNAVCAYLNGTQLDLDAPTSLCWGDPTGGNSTGWSSFSPTLKVTTGFLPSNTLTLVVFNKSLYTGVLLQGTFTPTGYIEVCKSSSTTNPVPPTGIYKFTVGGSAFSSSTNPLMVPVGECSGPIPVTAPTAIITELPTPGVGVSAITAVGYSAPPNSQEENLLESYDLQTLTATALLVPPATAGDTSTETIATFTNYEAPPGQLKVCKIAGAGVTVNTAFIFAVNAGAPFRVEAGPLDQGGDCVVVPGTFQVGTAVTVAEVLPAGDAAPTITVNGVSTLSAGCTPIHSCVVAEMGPGINEVSFTNSCPPCEKVNGGNPFTSLDIVNYSLVRQVAVTGTQSYMTYRADLLNRGTTAMGPITASVTSMDPSRFVVVGQGALNFAAVPADGQIAGSGTFTILANPAAPFDFSKLNWTFQSTRSMSPGQ